MSICPTEYWIWLQTALGAGARVADILAYFENPEKLYLAGSGEWRLSGLFTERKIQALKNSTPSQTGAVFKECREKGYTIITPDSIYYPDRLKKLPDMPLVIYGIGDCTVLSDTLSIGIVGTRNASSYGIETTQKLARSLASAGVTIVSGGALGVDSEAHAGAMLEKGRTFAFLGCGLSYDYLRENAAMRRAITRYGAVFSEYQPMTAPSKVTFPIRNRLISGASLGIVVIEAGIKSGSLITANCALEQGRDVFAVPGDIVRSSFDGTNHLIKNGAKPVFSAEDILSEYEYLYNDAFLARGKIKPLSDFEYVNYRKPAKQKNTVTTEPKVEKITVQPEKKAKVILSESEYSPAAVKVYAVLNDEAMHIDDIVRNTDLKMNEVLSSLTELELTGCIEQMTGKKYKKL